MSDEKDRYQRLRKAVDVRQKLEKREGARKKSPELIDLERQAESARRIWETVRRGHKRSYPGRPYRGTHRKDEQ